MGRKWLSYVLIGIFIFEGLASSTSEDVVMGGSEQPDL
jgi:hypothetical protein